MTNPLDPIVDQWYIHQDKGQMFRIVAADAATGSIEVQYFHGDVGQIERAAWRELDIEAAEPPEDWRISLKPHQPAGEAWQQRRAIEDEEVTQEARLVWRVISTVENVCWPSGLGKLH
jgi:hypothetical protein